MEPSEINIPNISLNDPLLPSLFKYFENLNDSGSFLTLFFKRLQELNPMYYNSTIHHNIMAIVGRMIVKRKLLLRDYYKIKESYDKGRIKMLEGQLREVSTLLDAEKLENQRLNEYIGNSGNENLKSIQKLRVDIANSQETVKESEERYESLKKTLEDSIKQNKKITAELEKETEKNINLKLKTDQYNKFFVNSSEKLSQSCEAIEKVEDEIEKLITDYDMKLLQEKEKIRKLENQIIVLTEENKKIVIESDLEIAKEKERTKEFEKKLLKIMERNNRWIRQANLPTFFYDDCINWNKEAISKCFESVSKEVDANEIPEPSKKKDISSSDGPPIKKAKLSTSIIKPASGITEPICLESVNKEGENGNYENSNN